MASLIPCCQFRAAVLSLAQAAASAFIASLKTGANVTICSLMAK